MVRRRGASANEQGTLKNYLLPHAGNRYHPKLFRTAAVASLIIGIGLLEGAYLFTAKIAHEHTSFLASVLPGALLSLANEDRQEAGVADLIQDPLLAQAAQLKADDMAKNGYFAHTSPDGKTPWYWLEQIGYSYTYAGENLAVNFEDSSAVERAWMNSPTHRANIVKPNYTRVGYGIARGMYKGKETTFVVQTFAAKASDASVTKTVPEQGPVKQTVQKIAATVQPQPRTPDVRGESYPRSEPAEPRNETEKSPAAEPRAALPADVVLGQETAPRITSESSVVSFAKDIAASPNRTSTYVLGGLALLFTILLGIALVWHANVRYLEVLGGGLVIILFTLSVLVYNATHTLTPYVSEGPAAQAATP